MKNEKDARCEDINNQLVKLKSAIRTTCFGLMAVQLLIFVLLMNVVRDTSKRDYSNWKTDYCLGYYSANEKKMIDNLENKMLLELGKIQNQITELKGSGLASVAAISKD